MSSFSGGQTAASDTRPADAYESIRTAVHATGTDSRVEVNQRALIDKILARYATAGAVYRELLQNSNDADATTAEIHFSTCPVPSGTVVTEVVYKNDGLPFRSQDWARMRKIAEGNPDVSKVGAFGVGAYTMFSICEEPMIVSGGQAMAFAWRGDALWVKVGKAPGVADQWTSFVLRSRDPYPLPDFVEFGQFLCSSLTFTASLKVLFVFVDGKRRLTISKRQLGKPRVITPPKASRWWKGDGAVTISPQRIFTLGRSDGSITETIVEINVDFDGDKSLKKARYVSASADTNVPSEVAHRMQRVTKKNVPPQVKIEVFVDASDTSDESTRKKKGKATRITSAFSPAMGAGRVFIGFKTSQTTGLAAHLAAPLLPTVEREAIDFQDPALRVYNCELLVVAGIVLRLTLEHSMSYIGEQYAKTEPERLAYEANNAKIKVQEESDREAGIQSAGVDQSEESKVPEESANSLFSFAKFMSSGVKKIANVITSTDLMGDGGEEDLFHPPDSRPLCKEEKDAISLMRSFSPQPSSPDALVGTVLAKGFQTCLPGVSPLVLTRSGMMRGLESKLPHFGIEGFVKKGVVRNVILKYAENYLVHVAGCQKLSMQDFIKYCHSNPLHADEIARLLKWWTRYSRADPSALAHSVKFKQSISFLQTHPTTSRFETEDVADIIIPLGDIDFYLDKAVLSSDLPMPPVVLPKELLDIIPERVLENRYLDSWFSSLPFSYWVQFIAGHLCLTAGRHEDAEIRMKVLQVLSREHSKLSRDRQKEFEEILQRNFSGIRCIPVDSLPLESCQTDFPTDLYLSSAELGIFRGLGVRKTVSIDFVFSQLYRLKWNNNPKPLIAFLRSTDLSASDLEKLKSTQYLPAVNDESRTFAPSELYFPSDDVSKFPCAKVLQWSSEPLHENSPNGEFLKKLGCRVEIPLGTLMRYLTVEAREEKNRKHGIDYLYKNLATGGSYTSEYNNFLDHKFLPATVENPLRTSQIVAQLQSPRNCYSSIECSCLGFPILASNFSSGERLGYGQVLRCATKPTPRELGSHFAVLLVDAMGIGKEKSRTDDVLTAFERIFGYLSTRSTEIDQQMIDKLSVTPFIPQKTGDNITWFLARDIYFAGDGSDGEDFTHALFPVREFNAFLATVGVRSQPSTEDIFRMVLSSPNKVLEKLGSSKYLSLLRRIAANPPYQRVTAEMKRSSFLLSIRVAKSQQDLENSQSGDSETSEQNKYVLAKASDVCIIDNSRYSRMFVVLAAPQESDIERFYENLGSRRISQKIRQKFFTKGGQQSSTELTRTFRERISERRPLLFSSLVSQPLKSEAVGLLSDGALHIYEVSSIEAKYYFESQKSVEKTTCTGYVGDDPANQLSTARPGQATKFSIFVTRELDWFHVANVIGSKILKRCDVQDAFLIASLLEAPLDQLRTRGFPVDRILRAAEPHETVQEPLRSPERNRTPKAVPVLKPVGPDKNIQDAGNQQKGGEPQTGRDSLPSFTSGTKKHKGDLLSRAVKGFRGFSRSGMSRPHERTHPESTRTTQRIGSMNLHQGTGNVNTPTSAGDLDDAGNLERVKKVLRQSVGSTRHISAKQKKVNIPPDEPDGIAPEAMRAVNLTCDSGMVKDLELFTGPSGASKASLGMRVFSTKGSTASSEFLSQNWEVVTCFEIVLSRLCSVYSLRLDTVAIFHETHGRIVAFNSAKRLFFNIRYFANLHHRTGMSYHLECYAFWWSVMAHELAHNLVSNHNREHGFFTERYTQTYLGVLVSTLKNMGDVTGI